MNNENKPTPHPHAELVHAWADGAKIQVKKDNGEWEECDFPLWNEKIEYRIKPSNEPWSPKTDDYLDVLYGEFCVVDSTWNSTDTDYALRRNNNIFPTEEEAEAAIPRVKAALKGATDVNANVGSNVVSPEIDGKPLSEGEVALIKALRRAERITDVYDYKDTVLVSANDNASGVCAHTQHIAFFTDALDSEDELIICALKQIKSEQKNRRKRDED